MQHRRSSFRALFSTVRFWSVWWVLAGPLACGEEHCDPSGQNCYYTSSDEASSDDDAPPCSSLSEADCKQSGHCFVDSVCKAPTCSGFNCGDSCELVHVCAENQ